MHIDTATARRYILGMRTQTQLALPKGEADFVADLRGFNQFGAATICEDVQGITYYIKVFPQGGSACQTVQHSTHEASDRR